MNKLTDFFGLAEQPIGSVRTLLTSTSDQSVEDGWVEVNRVYLQADYPELFDVVGLVGAGYFSTSRANVTSASCALYGERFVVYTSGLISFVPANHFMTSVDGINWLKFPDPTPTVPISAIAYAPTHGYIAVGATGKIIASTTGGASWVARTSGTAVQLNAAAWNQIFIVGGAGGVLRYSIDGITWLDLHSNTNADIIYLAFLNNNWVYLTSTGVVGTSTDGFLWRTRSITTSRLNSVTFNNGTYVAVGSGGVIFTSTDLINWTSRVSPTTRDLLTVNWSGVFAAAGAGGTLVTSTDGVTWVSRHTGLTTSINFIERSQVLDITVVGGVGFVGHTASFAQITSPLYDASIEFLVPDQTERGVQLSLSFEERFDARTRANIRTFMKAET